MQSAKLNSACRQDGGSSFRSSVTLSNNSVAVVVKAMRSKGASLEAVFLHLTGRELRD